MTRAERSGRVYDTPWTDEEVHLDLARAWWPEKVHRKQAQFVLGSSVPYQGLFGGRGSGKTIALGYKAVKLALQNPDCEGLVLGRTGRDLADKVSPAIEDAVNRLLDFSGVNVVKRFNRGDQSYDLFNGAKIILRPYGRPASLRLIRGYDVGWAVADEVEFAQVGGDAVRKVVTHALRSPRATHRELAVVSSPNGLRGFPAWFRDAQECGSTRHFVVTTTVYDNPFLDPAWLADLKEGSSKRDWLQEGLGMILTPSNTVFGAEYSEAINVRPWAWRKGLPYVLAVDWGENHAIFGAAQVEPDGTWTIAYEEKHEESSRLKFRDAIRKFTDGIYDKYGDKPYLFVGDRAVTSEMSWASMVYGTVCEGGVRKCETRDQQQIRRGLGLMSSLLAPLEGPPRLFVSSRLSTRGPEGAGIRYALQNYRWRVDRDGVLTDVPWKDDVCDHPIDQWRMALVMSAYDERLHGGKVLPFVRTEAPADYRKDRAYMRDPEQH